MISGKVAMLVMMLDSISTLQDAYGCRYETFRIDWLGIEVMLLNLPGSGILWLGVRGSAWCGWHKQLMTAVATLSLSGYDSVTCDVVQVTEVCCCRSVCVCGTVYHDDVILLK